MSGSDRRREEHPLKLSASQSFLRLKLKQLTVTRPTRSGHHLLNRSHLQRSFACHPALLSRLHPKRLTAQTVSEPRRTSLPDRSQLAHCRHPLIRKLGRQVPRSSKTLSVDPGLLPATQRKSLLKIGRSLPAAGLKSRNNGRWKRRRRVACGRSVPRRSG
jgi:hypothetical protein